mmetsp:Transcript_107009/g.320049  ORF Transcript_107009/g.320049 Transcript_107009/m.320049 type:complete len:253 (-) Transcript_107009:257-1015(-)
MHIQIRCDVAANSSALSFRRKLAVGRCGVVLVHGRHGHAVHHRVAEELLRVLPQPLELCGAHQHQHLVHPLGYRAAIEGHLVQLGRGGHAPHVFEARPLDDEGLAGVQHEGLAPPEGLQPIRGGAPVRLPLRVPLAVAHLGNELAAAVAELPPARLHVEPRVLADVVGGRRLAVPAETIADADEVDVDQVAALVKEEHDRGARVVVPGDGRAALVVDDDHGIALGLERVRVDQLRSALRGPASGAKAVLCTR